jgi:GR25 family glycosyltransferase involved in LPS biosynthesis
LKAFVITLEDHAYSEAKSRRCIESAWKFGQVVERFTAVPAIRSEAVMRGFGLRWTWANGNKSDAVCPTTKLKQHPYGNLAAKIGCSMSHYLLWRHCMDLDEQILILEHDAVFIAPLPEVAFSRICQINDPRGATPRGDWWSDHMAARGPGVWPVTHIFPDDKPDGLAGNSAYLVKPRAAEQLVTAFHQIGVWPNDATMCRQLFPDLQELYPFVTKVEQEQSTTCV